MIIQNDQKVILNIYQSIGIIELLKFLKQIYKNQIKEREKEII